MKKFIEGVAEAFAVALFLTMVVVAYVLTFGKPAAEYPPEFVLTRDPEAIKIKEKDAEIFVIANKRTGEEYYVLKVKPSK